MQWTAIVAGVPLAALVLVGLPYAALLPAYLSTAGRVERARPATANDAVRVTIVVTAYNEKPNALGACIDAVTALEFPGWLEVVLVDDGSEMSTAELDGLYGPLEQRLTRQGIDCTVLLRGENGGKRAAMADGVALANGDVTGFLDGDSVPHPDALAHTLAGFGDSRVGAVGGRIVVHNATTWLTRRLAARYAFEDLQRRVQARGRFLPWRGDDSGDVWRLAGAWMFFRTEPLKAVIDEFRGDGERGSDDVVLPRLIRDLGGWRVGYAHRAVVGTHVPTTRERLVLQQTRWSREVWKHGLRDLLRHRPLFATVELLSRLLVPAPVILALETAGAMAFADWPLAWAPLAVLAVPIVVVPALAGRARDASLLGLIAYFYVVHLSVGYVARWRGWRLRRTSAWLTRGARESDGSASRRGRIARVATAVALAALLLLPGVAWGSEIAYGTGAGARPWREHVPEAAALAGAILWCVGLGITARVRSST